MFCLISACATGARARFERNGRVALPRIAHRELIKSREPKPLAVKIRSIRHVMVSNENLISILQSLRLNFLILRNGIAILHFGTSIEHYLLRG